MRQPGQFALLLFIASGAWSAPVETLFAQVVVPLETPRFDVVLNNVYLPVYPPLARQARIMGDVKILVGVRQDGSVASAEVVSGHPMLSKAAVEAVRQWRYRPYLLNNQPIEVETEITVNFLLSGG